VLFSILIYFKIQGETAGVPRGEYPENLLTDLRFSWLCRKLKRVVAGFPPRRPVFVSEQACGICSGQSGTGAGFLRGLRFPLPIIIPQISPSS
jgi:hypothetical protein